jgi:RNA polymerase sigma-70 factor (ECF subfamily)
VREDEGHEWSRLMAAAQDGDQRSYVRLLGEVVPVLRRAARSRWPTAQPADIEDVVQETLKSLHAVRHTYDPARPFLPWLHAILRHRALDEMRRRARTSGREVTLDGHDETFPGMATNRDHEFSPDHAAVRQAVAALPPKQRMAVELLKLKEMSLKEASAASGMSVVSLKVATHRALKALRLTLGGKL